MSGKLIRFPWVDRKRNEIGEGYVGCEVSHRWLNITSSLQQNDGDTLYHIEIMTTNEEDVDRKLTEIVIHESDFLRAMKYAKSKK